MPTLNPAKYTIVVNRDKCRLYLYKRSILSNKYDIYRTFKIAIGKVGYETPTGLYDIVDKALNPDWHMPDSEWVAPENRGKVLPGGDPNNPIKGAFLSIYDGVGIHGTADIASLGSKASHGCIRMYPESAIYLYKKVPLGTLAIII